MVVLTGLEGGGYNAPWTLWNCASMLQEGGELVIEVGLSDIFKYKKEVGSFVDRTWGESVYSLETPIPPDLKRYLPRSQDARLYYLSGAEELEYYLESFGFERVHSELDISSHFSEKKVGWIRATKTSVTKEQMSSWAKKIQAFLLPLQEKAKEKGKHD